MSKGLKITLIVILTIMTLIMILPEVLVGYNIKSVKISYDNAQAHYDLDGSDIFYEENCKVEYYGIDTNFYHAIKGDYTHIIFELVMMCLTQLINIVVIILICANKFSFNKLSQEIKDKRKENLQKKLNKLQ